MHLNLLDLDGALDLQPDFVRACKNLGAKTLDAKDAGSRIRLWGTPDGMRDFKGYLQDGLTGLKSDNPLVTWMGSGDFHHVSALLLSLLTEARQQPVTVVMFDNHPDWVRFRRGVHCGSWVNHALKSEFAVRVIGIGMSSQDLAWPEFKGAGLDLVASGKFVMFPVEPPKTYVFGRGTSGPAHEQCGRRIAWTEMPGTFSADSARRVLDCIETTAIYITMDKDVLRECDAATNWDQGKLTLTDLISWLRLLAAHHTVLGVDIVGDYSPPRIGGSAISRILKKGEIYLDHPANSFNPEDAAAINQTTNLAILTALSEALC